MEKKTAVAATRLWARMVASEILVSAIGDLTARSTVTAFKVVWRFQNCNKSEASLRDPWRCERNNRDGRLSISDLEIDTRKAAGR